MPAESAGCEALRTELPADGYAASCGGSEATSTTLPNNRRVWFIWLVEIIFYFPRIHLHQYRRDKHRAFLNFLGVQAPYEATV